MGQKRAGSPTGAAAKRAKTAKAPKTASNKIRDSYPPAKALPQPKQEDRKPDNPEGEREKLREWLEKAEKDGKDAFRIKYPGPRTKKSKPHAGPTQSLRIGEKELSMTIEYFIDPQTKWSRLSKYRKFTVGGETYSVGDVVLVKHGDSIVHDDDDDTVESEDDPAKEGDNPVNEDDNTAEKEGNIETDEDFAVKGHIDLAQQWKALVVEVRALDENHVFLRVTWLENPEDLPGGRKSYHGKYELVPSNDMSIIDAMTVNGGIKVKHWDDADDTSKIPAEDEFFWRQEYEKDLALGGAAGSGKLSVLHKICECEEPHNPDEKIIHCEECGYWLHTTCIAEDAVKRANTRAQEDLSTETPQNTAIEGSTEDQKSSKSTKTKAKTKRKSKAPQSNGSPDKHPVTDAFRAIVEASDDATPRILIQDVEGARNWEEEVKCLHCSKVIV